MYFNSKSKWLGRNAVLWTPKFKAKKDSCLTFWYRMSGPNIGMLKVHFAKIKHVRYEGPVVWMRRGDQGTNWNQEYVNIGQDVDLYVSISFIFYKYVFTKVSPAQTHFLEM